MPPAATVEERFWRFVPFAPPDKCWEWSGQLTDDGYGIIRSSRSSQPGHRKKLLGHRVAWTIIHGPIPEGMFVLHHCDNPPCVNAFTCLFLGTQADNVADCIAKGRFDRTASMYGSGHKMAKLDESKVAELRRLATQGVSGVDLAVRFGISRANVSMIINRKAWTHLP